MPTTAKAFSYPFFAADDGFGSGNELWRSDGTVAGTGLHWDINRYPPGSDPVSLRDVAGTLYFSAQRGHGTEPWIDRPPAGPRALTSIDRTGSDSSGPRSLVDVAGSLMFAASTPAAGWELWRSDGTQAGTALVRDVATARRGPRST